MFLHAKKMDIKNIRISQAGLQRTKQSILNSVVKIQILSAALRTCMPADLATG